MASGTHDSGIRYWPTPSPSVELYFSTTAHGMDHFWRLFLDYEDANDIARWEDDGGRA